MAHSRTKKQSKQTNKNKYTHITHTTNSSNNMIDGSYHVIFSVSHQYNYGGGRQSRRCHTPTVAADVVIIIRCYEDYY